jgi:hypothetical protein
LEGEQKTQAKDCAVSDCSLTNALSNKSGF